MEQQRAKASKEIKRGEEARQVLENPLYQDAFREYEAQIREKWEDTAVRDTEDRELLWMMLQVVKRVRADLEEVMQTGRIASIDLERIENVRRNQH